MSSAKWYLFDLGLHELNIMPELNGRQHTDDIFKMFFLNVNCHNVAKILVKFVPWGSIDDKSSLVRVMVWHRTGGEPLAPSRAPFY